MTREDKDAIIRRLEAMYGEAEDNETKEALFYAIEALKEQRPHGEWVEVKRYNRKGKRFLDCSVCHYGEKGEIVCEVTKVPNFCPNCGADMRGETE